MALLTIDETLNAVAAEAEQLGYMTLVSGRLVIGAEYHRGQVVWYVHDRRATLEQVRQALEKARAARHADHPSIA
ncbi:hypothetical protein ADM96_08310 [Burkholderia sp. ST111]|nr:hypothetical protein ADM96_08310 [Burkholderia sp. ST111]